MNTVLKISFFFSFIFLNAVLSGQDRSERDKHNRIEAEQDWANGNAQYYGSSEMWDIDYTLYFEHLGLFLTPVGCLSHDRARSYNPVIEEKLKEKYGRDMFITLKKDRRVFYDSLNHLKNRKAIFRRGEKHLLDWFNQSARDYIYYNDKKMMDLSSNLKIRLSFTINKRGKCKNFNLTKTENAQFDEKILKMYKRFFKYFYFLPAKENGVRIKEEKAYDIVFNPD
jgi:hypothetical protein